MILEKNGKFYRAESSEKEISELEFLREKIKELEGKIEELQRRPTYIPYIPIADPTPWNVGPFYCNPYQTITTFGTEVK